MTQQPLLTPSLAGAGVSSHPFVRWLDEFFHFTERGSSLRTEIIAGLTTFGTYSYILVVNPLIMVHAGMDRGALITVTALVAAIFTVIMGLRTNYPLAMAPGMGGNAYLAIQVCQGMKVPWQGMLGIVFYAGVLFFLISVTGIRQKIIEAFPASFKKIISVGIGFFVAFLGLRQAGIIVANPNTFVALGHFNTPSVILAFVGIVLLVLLLVKKVPGAMVLSIVALALIGLFIPGTIAGAKVTTLPTHVFDWPNSIAPIFLQLDFGYFWSHFQQCVPIVLALVFSDLFSAMAVLVAVGTRAHLNDENGNLPKLKEALSADAASAMGASLLGSNLPIIYLESAAGVEAGGRTGLVSIVIAICFLLALFLTPVIAAIPGLATVPALVAIGVFMMQVLADIDLRDLTTAATALVSILLMCLASVGDGLALGYITWVALSVFTGKARAISKVGYALCALFAVHFLFPS
jgi:AGZA family xanthine/uracil permease-like MFS transporter